MNWNKWHFAFDILFSMCCNWCDHLQNNSHPRPPYCRLSPIRGDDNDDIDDNDDNDDNDNTDETDDNDDNDDNDDGVFLSTFDEHLGSKYNWICFMCYKVDVCYIQSAWPSGKSVHIQN